LRRRLLNLLTALSLLLCVALLILWIATADRPWTTTWRDAREGAGVRVGSGALAVARVHYQPPVAPQEPLAVDFFLEWRDRAGGHGTVPSLFGFDYYDEVLSPSNLIHAAGTAWFQVLYVPLWPLAAVTAVLPATWLYRRRRRQRRRRRGRCPNCGYDLRANVSGVCPECGRGVTP
jgi:hypothetical protein